MCIVHETSTNVIYKWPRKETECARVARRWGCPVNTASPVGPLREYKTPTNLFEVSRSGPDEHDCKVACGGGGDRRQSGVEEQHRHGGDGLFASQRRIHIQSTEVLADGLQFL